MSTSRTHAVLSWYSRERFLCISSNTQQSQSHAQTVTNAGPWHACRMRKAHHETNGRARDGCLVFRYTSRNASHRLIELFYRASDMNKKHFLQFVNCHDEHARLSKYMYFFGLWVIQSITATTTKKSSNLINLQSVRGSAHCVKQP